MKKYFFMFLIILFLSFFIKIPKYVELNEIKIIKSITVDCSNNYSIVMKEIKPIKKDNGFSYTYKKYSGNGNSFIRAIKSIENNNHNKFYYKAAVINMNKCSNKKEIENYFSISN